MNAQALEPEAGFAKAQAQLLGTSPYASIDTQSFDSVSLAFIRTRKLRPRRDSESFVDVALKIYVPFWFAPI